MRTGGRQPCLGQGPGQLPGCDLSGGGAGEGAGYRTVGPGVRPGSELWSRIRLPARRLGRAKVTDDAESLHAARYFDIQVR